MTLISLAEASWPGQFVRRGEDVYRLREWQPCIEIDGWFVDLITRGETQGLSVSGHVEHPESQFPLMVFDTLTITCMDGEAVYNLFQDSDAWKRDCWKGTLRSSSGAVDA